MDYSPFFAAQTTQPYQFMGVPPTPQFPEDDKISEPIDPSLFPPQFDSFRYGGLVSAAEMPAPPMSMAVGSVDSGLGADGMGDMLPPQRHDSADSASGRNMRRGSSEEKELTPAQSRRKAQNRAAQRAFRERRERHVKDLEAKLSALENSVTSLASDKQRLELALQRATTENEMLRTAGSTRISTSSNPPSDPSSSNPSPSVAVDPAYSAPSQWKHDSGAGMTSAATTADERLLAAPATWDLIQSHPLVQQGLVDIADVCERLRSLARCDGNGPVFPQREIQRAVEQSRRAGGDGLI